MKYLLFICLGMLALIAPAIAGAKVKHVQGDISKSLEVIIKQHEADMKANFDKLYKTINALNGEFSRINSKLTIQNERLESIEKSVEEIRSKIKVVKGKAKKSRYKYLSAPEVQ